eukprot:scaffold28643_cov19-Tisochrysis_lutea.AAC.3
MAAPSHFAAPAPDACGSHSSKGAGEEAGRGISEGGSLQRDEGKSDVDGDDGGQGEGSAVFGEPQAAGAAQDQHQQPQQKRQRQRRRKHEAGGGGLVSVVLVTASQDRFFVLSHVQLSSGLGTYTPAAAARVRAIGEEAERAAEATAAAAAARASLGLSSGATDGGHAAGGLAAAPHAQPQHAHEDVSKGGTTFSGWRRSAADKAAGVAATAASLARETFRVASGPPPPAAVEGKQKRVGEVGFGGPLLRLPEALRERWVGLNGCC